MNPIGPGTTSSQWLDRLANLVHEIRADWDAAGIRSALLKVSDRPLHTVASAALAACTRADQRTPAFIALDGEHWRTPGTQPPTREPGIVTRCEHGQPGARCPECYPRNQPRTGPTDEQRATMRAAIAQAKAATKAREIPTGQER